MGKNKQMLQKLCQQLDGNKFVKAKKKFISDIDYTKSSVACPACSAECKKIDEKINNRKLSELKSNEVAHILNIFEDKE